MERLCFACGARLTPHSPNTYTSHEFKCGKLHPELIPERFLAEHESTLKWEKRSAAAKRGVETRRAQGGKRAPRN